MDEGDGGGVGERGEKVTMAEMCDATQSTGGWQHRDTATQEFIVCQLL